MRLWMIAGCIGIVLASFFPKLPAPFWLSPLSVFFIISCKYRLCRLPGALCLGLCWGLSYGILAMKQQLPTELEGVDISVRGRVTGLISTSARTQSFDFRLIESSGRAGGVKKVRLTWYQTQKRINPGEIYNLTVRLKKPHGFANPGGFDYETWLFQRGIGATGYVRAVNPDNKGQAGHGWNLKAQIDVIRADLAARFAQQESGYVNGEIIAALLVGVKDGISPKLWRLFTRTGTNHLFVISGLHIGFVALCAGWLALRVSRWLLLGPPAIAAPQIAACSALLASFIYSALAGFSLPTQRALVMLVVMLVGKLFKRYTDAWTGYCVALFLVLLLDPLATESVGFWLSFGAVAALLYGYFGYCSNTGLWWRWGRPQWIVFIAFIPVLLGFFFQISVVSPLVNLLAVPLVGLVIVPLCLLGGLLMTFSETGASPFLWCADQGITGLIGLMEFVTQWSGSVWQARVDDFKLWLALAGVMLLLAPRGLPLRWFGSIPLIALLSTHNNGLKTGEYRAGILDVGQGLAVVLETANRTLVYDVGAKYTDRFNAVDAVLLPYLKFRTVTQLDRVLVSHSDNDHAGALPYLLEVMPHNGIIAGSDLDRVGETVVGGCAKGAVWQWDGVEFQLMQARQVSWNNENNRSCVLRVTNGHVSMLLPGDIEVSAERDLMGQKGLTLRSDILLAPHHGSNTSSSPDFIDRVDPDTVIFSVGYRNRFKHPRQEVVQRYTKRAIRQLDSASSGAIIITAPADGKPAKIIKWRETFRRYWF